MRSASQCVWVTSGNMYKRSMCQTGFQRFQTGFGWFPTIFSGVSASSTVNLGWSLEEYVMRGHQFWTCWFSHFESTGLADPDKQTSESLGFELPAHQSCHIQNKTSKSLERAMGCQISAGWFGSLPSPFVLQIFDLGEKCWNMLENTTPQEA